jgi:tetratricopeptide (TPR) repeat protein
MTTQTLTTPEVLTAEQFQPVLELYERGLCLQAYRRSEALGPLKDWRGPDARVLAGRLAGNLAAPRLAAWHFYHAFRADPTHPEVCWYHVRELLERRGPLRAWQVLQRCGDFPNVAAATRAPWLALHTLVLGRLRDFEAAQRWLRRAEEVAPESAWVRLERCSLLLSEDRPEAALAAAQEALQLRPWYRPAVQMTAHLLVQFQRDAEAMDLLREADQRIENGAIAFQLAALQTELRQYADARRSYERFAELSPLMEKFFRDWLSARRSDSAYFCGDREQALEHARQTPGPFYEEIARRLAEPAADAKRVVLPVGFVRQHHLTCAPATLAALCRFWSMPGEHLEVAAAICYDGTPSPSERHWAETNGWVVREFTLTWDSAVALLDRGVPFTLTTVEPTSSHLQAVIGYDGHRGTLLLRDPGERHQSEAMTGPLLQRYRANGPRGMALVPKERAELFDGLDLPDAALHDLNHRLQRALQRHDRPAAVAALGELEAQAPDHPLALQARRTLAAYDCDSAAVLAAIDRLLALFPDDLALQMMKVTCLRELGRRDERVALLQQLSDRPATDPVCWQQLAQELSGDAREYPVARRLLRRALRCNPTSAGNYYLMANLLWDHRRRAEALEVYRFAACLEDKDEQLAQAYFSAARWLQQTEELLRLLRERVRRLGASSSRPVRTLCWALDQLERSPEAFVVLEEALRLRPDDGDLLLYAAQLRNRHGDRDRATQVLTAARGRAQESVWARAAADFASAAGDSAAALALWRQVLAVEPLALDAHRAAAQLLAETEGRPAALEHLRQCCARLPHHFGLHRLFIEWLREEGAAALEPVVRQALTIHPADAWARRELALTLADQGRFDEAFAELAIADDLEPSSPSNGSVRGRVCQLAGRMAECREANRAALRLSVDFDIAINELVQLCDTLAERQEALAFIEEQLLTQVHFGDGVLAYREQGGYNLPPEELLVSLRHLQAARPDLWQTWAALVRQLVAMPDLDQAHDVATEAVERFPLVPALWADLARVGELRGDRAAAIDALRRALEINPNWYHAVRQLADLYEGDGRTAEARRLLEQAAARAPLVAANHGVLARLLWQQGEHDAALERVRQAVRLEPGYEWAWERLSEWARHLDRPDEAVAAARDLAERRPFEARSWLMLARMLTRQAGDEYLAALRQAVAVHPRCYEALDLQADYLARAGRFDEALAALQAPADEQPLFLRGRAAWVTAESGELAAAVERMDAVLREDPNYLWGWRNVAEWRQRLGDWAGYRAAAEEMLRLAPGDAQALAFRGDARLHDGDRAGGREDLQAAVEQSPDYGFAGMTLFDAQLADDEFDAAAHTLMLLEEHVGGDFVVARAAQLAAKRDDEEAAGDALRRLCDHVNDATWPLDAAVRALRGADMDEVVDEVIRAAVREPEFSPQAAMLWADECVASDEDAVRACLEALDRAVDLCADPATVFDARASLLVRAGRHDEALAACAPPIFKEAPMILRGRAAWVEKQRGRGDEALARMQATVREFPDYYWGWSQLVEWYEEKEDFAAMLVAAEQMVRLAPNYAPAYGYRGEARRHGGDLAGARADFARAFELDPAYQFAGLSLFDQQVLAGDFDDAEATLEGLRRHVAAADVRFKEIKLHTRRKRPDVALRLLREACAQEKGWRWQFDQALQELADAGHGDEAERVLRLALAGETCHELAGEVLVERRAARGLWFDDAALAEFATLGEPGRKALMAHLSALGKAKQPARLTAFARRFEELLRRDTALWGHVGYAYGSTAVSPDALIAAALHDWEQHADAKPWMLINLAIALRGLGRVEEAVRVHRHALTLEQHDFTLDFHHVWLALEDALAGDAKAAALRMEDVDRDGLDSYHAWLAELLDAVLRVDGAASWERATALRQSRALLAARVQTSEPMLNDRAAVRTYRRCVRRMGQRCGAAGLAWAAWRCWRPMLPKPRVP